MSNTPSLTDIPLTELGREDFEALFDQHLATNDVREQSVVNGEVIEIGSDYVTVDIGFKAEGMVPRSEFISPEGELTIEVGDHVDVYLDMMDENRDHLMLSKERADLMKAWEEISKAVERDEVVAGTIVARVKGGLQVDIGVKAFLPGSRRAICSTASLTAAKSGTR